MTLAEELRSIHQDDYAQFVEKYGKRIDEECRKVFGERHRSNWSCGVYEDKKDLLREIYYDHKINGGGFNNLIKYLRMQGFNVTASYWCGGACKDADGFTASL